MRHTDNAGGVSGSEFDPDQYLNLARRLVYGGNGWKPGSGALAPVRGQPERRRTKQTVWVIQIGVIQDVECVRPLNRDTSAFPHAGHTE